VVVFLYASDCSDRRCTLRLDASRLAVRWQQRHAGNGALSFWTCRYFYPKLDQLLVEETLVGRSAACREALRPLALSMLAELIHHVRTQLKYGQLVTIIHTFSR
jgi:hypothetical protein